MLTTLATLMLAWTCATTEPDLSGAWHVRMPALNETKPDGSKISMRAIEGTLVLVQKGNELTGTWKTIEEWNVTGRVDDAGRFALTSEVRDYPATRNENKAEEKARWTIRGTLTNGAMSGTAILEVANRGSYSRKWSATRK